MKPTEDNKPIDWRARLHSLPSGIEPASPVVGGCAQAFLWFGLFIVGSVFIFISGPAVGLLLGIGPGNTGGTLYVLFGLILNLLVGAGIAALVARSSTSRSMPRLVFYIFTAPAFLAVILLALSFTKRLLE